MSALYTLPVFVSSFANRPNITKMFLSEHQTLERIIEETESGPNHSSVVLRREVNALVNSLIFSRFPQDADPSRYKDALLFLFKPEENLPYSNRSSDEMEQYYETRVTHQGDIVVLVREGFFTYLVEAREHIPNLLSTCHRRAYENGRVAVDRLTREIGIRSLELNTRGQVLDSLITRLRFLKTSIDQ